MAANCVSEHKGSYPYKSNQTTTSYLTEHKDNQKQKPSQTETSHLSEHVCPHRTKGLGYSYW